MSTIANSAPNGSKERSLPGVNSKVALSMIAIALLVLPGAMYFSSGDIVLLAVNDDLVEDGGNLFLKYFFIVVAVERAAAVFVEIFRTKTINWNLRISRIQGVLDKELDDISLQVLQQMYFREQRIVGKLMESGEMSTNLVLGETDVSDEKVKKQEYEAYLVSAKQSYDYLRAEHLAASNRYVAMIVFFGAIVLAVLGLSVFQDIFGNLQLTEVAVKTVNTAGQAITGWQKGLLRLSDILITGGLLGGGSAGLNQISIKLNEIMNRS
jgi:hypothetical protein